MWVVGDWGQASPWTRDTGVLMTKGDNGVYTGELSLPKGTKFDIKILKSTVSTTSGGDNAWSAVRYASTLNLSASHDFGEFTDNLIPNGNFEEGQVKWTPVKCIVEKPNSLDGEYLLSVGGPYNPVSCASDVFVIPPNQTLRLTGYVRNWLKNISGTATMNIVTPQQETLFEFSVGGVQPSSWIQFSKTFETSDVPMECKIVFTNNNPGKPDTSQSWETRLDFEKLSLVSP